jgi:hypothetical protein
MPLFKRLISLFYKSSNDKSIKAVTMPDDRKEYEELDSDKIEMLLKKYSCEDKKEFTNSRNKCNFYRGEKD